MLMDRRYLLQQHLHLLTAVRRDRRSEATKLTCQRRPEPGAPFVVGQHLRQLGLLYLHVVQPALKLLDAGGVNRQVLADLSRRNQTESWINRSQV